MTRWTRLEQTRRPEARPSISEQEQTNLPLRPDVDTIAVDPTDMLKTIANILNSTIDPSTGFERGTNQRLWQPPNSP